MIDLTPIKSRLDAATPTEWAKEIDPYDDLKFWRIVTQDNVYLIARGMGDSDADLIAHAPADLRALIAEVKRLRTEVAVVREDYAKDKAWYEDVNNALSDTLRALEKSCAEVELLRACIKELVEAINDMGEGECEIDRLYNAIARAERVLSNPTDGGEG